MIRRYCCSRSVRKSLFTLVCSLTSFFFISLCPFSNKLIGNHTSNCRKLSLPLWKLINSICGNISTLTAGIGRPEIKPILQVVCGNWSPLRTKPIKSTFLIEQRKKCIYLWELVTKRYTFFDFMNALTTLFLTPYFFRSRTVTLSTCAVCGNWSTGKIGWLTL